MVALVVLQITSAFYLLSKMDDCTLQTLSVKPGKLSPVYKRDVTDYRVTVGCNVEQLTIDCYATDSGASYTISVM